MPEWSVFLLYTDADETVSSIRRVVMENCVITANCAPKWQSRRSTHTPTVAPSLYNPTPSFGQSSMARWTRYAVKLFQKRTSSWGMEMGMSSVVEMVADNNSFNFYNYMPLLLLEPVESRHFRSVQLPYGLFGVAPAHGCLEQLHLV